MPVVMTTVEQASTLLDFNKKLDIGLLDNVVACFYSSDGPEVGGYLYYGDVRGPCLGSPGFHGEICIALTTGIFAFFFSKKQRTKFLLN